MKTFIRLPEVKQMIGISATSTLYDLIRNGRFPKPIKLSPRVSVWDSEQIQNWMAERASKSVAA
ncbi:MAG: AlpA family phage regulatory protein [Bosea sp.]|uniref:helix-turn-helix transcriptional regulator n=1 Tax=Bosea sp. (in: a-proteobacteria) TaxID=1871050 RepID=UPI001AD569A0|nr:AlpA family phage regulatory protein [Bosea sp. (in: a-proteobacteria)]